MPGNDVGDRVHNFFGQDNLSQGQYNSQAVDGNWHGLSNNGWAGSQTQIGMPFISNLKNFNLPQSDSQQGYTSQSLHSAQGLNPTQLNLRRESGRSHSQNQQPAVNGHMQGHTLSQTKQNETNFLGIDKESDRHNLTSRGISMFESQQGNGPELYKKNLAGSAVSESPVNFDFFGAQQHTSSRHPIMMQTLPRQLYGISDMHLLQQQQLMLTQMQQLQHMEVRQRSPVSNASSTAKQAASNQSASLITGIPVNNAPNLMWQPEVMTTNQNWLQRGASQVLQGSTSGLIFSPGQGQASCSMGLVTQHADQSLYVLPVSSSRGTTNQYSHAQVEKPAMPQVPVSGNSFPAHQLAAFSDQSSAQDVISISRQESQGKNMFGPSGDRDLNMENLQQVNSQQRNVPAQEFHGKQELVGSSERMQKLVMQAAPSQNVATLDPTEEKILFGSDDLPWDVFGKNAGGSSMLDGTDCFSGFPSVQSGSWSALMQSAVAETSSSDIGIQEDWSGLSFRTTGHSSGNQRLVTSDSGEQQLVGTDNNTQVFPNMTSRLCPDEVVRPSAVTNHRGFHGIHQSSFGSSHDRSQTDSTLRSTSQSLERSKLSDSSPHPKSLAEGSHIYNNVSNSSFSNVNGKSMSYPSTDQNTFPPCTGGMLTDRLNGWNYIESMAPDNYATSKNHDKDNSSQPSHRIDKDSTMHVGQGHVPGMWKTDSVQKSSVSLEPVKSTTCNLMVHREDSSLASIPVMPNSGTTRSNQQSIEHLRSGHTIGMMRDVDSFRSSRDNEGALKTQHHLQNPQILEPAGNNLEKGSGIHDMEDSNMKSSSTDVIHSAPSHHLRAGGLGGSSALDASDSWNLPGSKTKLSDQVNRRPPMARKFQYHPMGDLDDKVEPSYGNRHVINSQSMPQHALWGLKGQDQEYPGQPKYGQAGNRHIEVEKGHLPSFQGTTKDSDKGTPKNILPAHVPKRSGLDRNIGNCGPSQLDPPSQNMLELLHKVDQSREHGTATQTSSSDQSQSCKLPEAENSDGSVPHPPRNQYSGSQGFGLQLAPPSQLVPDQDHVKFSHDSVQKVLSTSNHTAQTGEKGHRWLAPTQSVLAQGSFQGECRNDISHSGQYSDKALPYNNLGKFPQTSAPGFSFTGAHGQNQNIAVIGGQWTSNQSLNYKSMPHAIQMGESCERAQTSQSALTSFQDAAGSSMRKTVACSTEISQLSTPNLTNAEDSPQETPLEAMPESCSFVMHNTLQQGSSPKVVHNVWTSVSTTKQHHLGAHRPKVPSHSQLGHDFEAISGSKKLSDQDTEKEGSDTSGVGVYHVLPQGFDDREQLMAENYEQQALSQSADPAKSSNASHNKEPLIKHLPDASYSSQAATKQDIEAFGRSLRPNNFMQQNYSALHQVQTMKSTGDLNSQSMKRFKGPDSGVDLEQARSRGGQQMSYGYNTMVKDKSYNHISLPSADPKALSLSDNLGGRLDTSAPSGDILESGQRNPHNFPPCSTLTTKSGHYPISPQMAPSWFGQFEAFKNGNLLPVYDLRKMATSKAAEQPFVGKQLESLHAHNSTAQVNAASDTNNAKMALISASIGSKHMASLLVPPNAADGSSIITRPKKRKSATAELLPWHKELTQNSQRLQNISMAELDWAQATNRLIEKMEDDTELCEDSPMLKSKRRLILTTQLLQQLLHAPPAAVLCADLNLNYESLAYCVARLTLGDACAISCSGRDTIVPTSSGNCLFEKPNLMEKIGDQYRLKVVEDLITRAKKVENDVLRLDQRASILDLRVECQDLERFSVINRFAKFHGRVQNDGVDAASSDATLTTQRSYPQRYVSAVPMPRNLPDRVQCLSL